MRVLCYFLFVSIGLAQHLGEFSGLPEPSVHITSPLDGELIVLSQSGSTVKVRMDFGFRNLIESRDHTVMIMLNGEPLAFVWQPESFLSYKNNGCNDCPISQNFTHEIDIGEGRNTISMESYFRTIRASSWAFARFEVHAPFAVSSRSPIVPLLDLPPQARFTDFPNVALAIVVVSIPGHSKGNAHMKWHWVAAQLRNLLVHAGVDVVLSESFTVSDRCFLTVGWDFAALNHAAVIDGLLPGSCNIVYNLAPLGMADTFVLHPDITRRLNERSVVLWDYSWLNVHKLRALGLKNVHYVPFAPHVGSSINAKLSYSAVAEDLDVVVYGPPCARRSQVVEQLRSEELSVSWVTDVFNTNLTSTFLRSKIVLFVRESESETLDTPGILFALSQRRFVVVEEVGNSVDASHEVSALQSIVVFASLSKLGTVCQAFIHKASHRNRLRLQSHATHGGQLTAVALPHFAHALHVLPSLTTTSPIPPLSLGDIVFAIITGGVYHGTRAAQIHKTWAASAEQVVFFSEIDDDVLRPVVFSDIGGDKKAAQYKPLRALEYLHANYASTKWFYIADDDSYVNPRNVLEMLRGFDHRSPHYIGEEMFMKGDTYASGGAGYAVSRAALEAVHHSLHGDWRRAVHEKYSDLTIGRVMREAGVFVEDHPAFFSMAPSFYVGPNIVIQKKMVSAPVSFHYILPEWMQYVHACVEQPFETAEALVQQGFARKDMDGRGARGSVQACLFALIVDVGLLKAT